MQNTVSPTARIASNGGGVRAVGPFSCTHGWLTVSTVRPAMRSVVPSDAYVAVRTGSSDPAVTPGRVRSVSTRFLVKDLGICKVLW